MKSASSPSFFSQSRNCSERCERKKRAVGGKGFKKIALMVGFFGSNTTRFLAGLRSRNLADQNDLPEPNPLRPAPSVIDTVPETLPPQGAQPMAARLWRSANQGSFDCFLRALLSAYYGSRPNSLFFFGSSSTSICSICSFVSICSLENNYLSWPPRRHQVQDQIPNIGLTAWGCGTNGMLSKKLPRCRPTLRLLRRSC